MPTEEFAPKRRRDSAATRADLLRAARRLFGTRGYNPTTVREIAELAGVDAALVARYYGSKAGLYRATLDADRTAVESRRHATEGSRMKAGELAEYVIGQADVHGLRSSVIALIDPDTPEDHRRDARERTMEYLHGVVRTGESELDPAELDLRLQLVSSALAGIAMMRRHSGLDPLSTVSADRLAAVLAPALELLIAPGTAPDAREM